MYDEPKPFDMWTRKHIALDPRWTCRWEPGSFQTIPRQYPDFPQIKPDLRAGGLNLYSDATVDAWFAAVDKWVVEKPAREAARRAQADRQFLARRDAEHKAGVLQMELIEQGIEATAQGIALAEQRKYTGPVTRG